ncbi:hypothetical protein DL98DRAFT_660528 [Cadophora sp. DSE1049]|nr:hypothetical protein DL98DRAFT_660528 [Cadophora sp. DSE1049]
MAISSAQIKLTDRPVSKLQIGKAFFGDNFEEENLSSCQSYFKYYIEELDLLRTGISEEIWQISNLAVKTYEDIFFVVNVVRANSDCRRPQLRSLLRSRFNTTDDLGLNRSINLSIRLWLMINFQEPEFRGIRHGATCFQWDDETTLRVFFQNLFPTLPWQITARSSRLGPHFTAAFMQRVCGLKIEWTTNLPDHLHLDRRRKALKIFPYKCHLQAMTESHKNSTDKNEPLIPLSVLNEPKASLDLLFPFWDSRAVAFLEKEKQTFHEYGPFEVAKSLTLLDFDHWRDRLLELHEEIFQSPPVSWAQLWRDRRNPQQFWTFWIALMILLLTILSTLATIIQAWASVKALK